MSDPRPAPNGLVPGLPSQARVVVIGGGIVGTSVLFHLTERGWNDVVLLERNKLTSGTTWHAAGLVGQVRASRSMTSFASYAKDLFRELERRTGDGTGFEQHGSVLCATTEGRWTEIQRSASLANATGIAMELITPERVGELWPLVNTDGILGAAMIPGDGMANPTDVTLALAEAARLGGAQVFEGTAVTRIVRRDGRVAGVETERGTIECEYVVNCTGMWARELGAQDEVAVPLHAAEHFYLVTEPIEALSPDLPVLRLPDEQAYVRNEAGKLMVGFFEPGAKPWATHGIPDSDGFMTLPEDWDHLEQYLVKAANRIPVFGQVGIQLFFNGPESFTPDGKYILGEAPQLPGYFVATGFNSSGFVAGGGAGRAIADWIVDGRQPLDLWEVDIRRFMPFQRSRRYLHERTRETVGLVYTTHWPFRQMTTARGIRRSPLHDRLAARGACFGEVYGWERANWYAPEGVAPEYEYSYGRQNWFRYSAEEHRAVRENVALFDQTSFGKIQVAGRDAARELNRICTADIDVGPGRIVYTQFCNGRGGIEADVTVTRHAEDRFLVVTTGTQTQRDLHWLRTHLDPDAHVTLTDTTSAEAVISIMGPRSREFLQTLTDADMSNAAFPFGAAREIDLGYAFARAARTTYVGELGWELYVPMEFATHIYDAIVEAGAPFDLRHAGYHALNSLRMEKAYRHWGHDMSDEDTLLEAGLGFTAAWEKPGGFIGRDALLAQREQGLHKRLVALVLNDPEPLMYHNEPIWRDGELVGWITSAMFGHTIGRSIGLGYVKRTDGGRATNDWINAGTYELEIARKRFAATVSLRAPHDPSNWRIRR